MPLAASRSSVETRPKRWPARADRPHSEAAPAAPIARKRSGLVPWGLVGAIALVLTIEAGVARRWQELSDPTSLSWQYADRAARADAAGRDVLYLGDSLVKHGLVPSVVEDASGLSGVNLSAARAPALFTYFVLRRALDSGARPSAIVFDTKPAVLIGGIDYNAHYWPAALTARECLELAGIAGKRPLGLAILTARLLPSLQSRLEVRSGILAALKATEDPIREINRVLWRNWSVNGGANVAMLDSPFRGELPADIGEKLHPDRFYADGDNAEGIARLLDLARGRGVRVYWLLPPISPALQARRDAGGAEAKFEAFVRSYMKRFPGVVTVLDGRRIAREPSLYVDATHLSGRGAVVLSRAVGTAIRDELSARPGDRRGWIALGEPAPEAGPALEDVERSKRIVRGLP